MFGDKRVIDEGAFERAQQGISDRNKTAYQNYVNNLNQSYDDLGFLGKLATGVSGGGWGKSNYLKNYGITDEIDALGKAGNINTTGMNSLYDAGNAYSQQRLKQLNQGQGLFSGIPLVGSIIDPFAQLVSGGKDLVESGTSKWDKGDRSLVSDIGAGIEAGLTLASLGALGKAKAAAKAGTAIAPTTLKSAIAKGAGRGAIYGGVGSLGNYLNTAGDQASVGDAALNAAMGAGIGGIIGGGISGAGYGIGKLRSNALTGNQKVAEAAAAAQKAQGDVTAYQDAMKAAQDLGLDTSSNEALKNSYRAYSVANHPDKAGNVIALLPSSTADSGSMTAQEAQNLVNTINQNAVNAATAAQSEAGNIYNTLYNTNLSDLLSTSKSAQSALKKASNQALLDYLKGTKLGKLGSSKLGKAAAVGGAAYGVSRLLGNRNGGNNE